MVPVLRGLREERPEAELWVFAPEEYRVLLEGWFDRFVATPREGRRPRDAALDETRWPYLNAGVRFERSIDLFCPAYRHEHDRRGEVWLDRIDLFCRAAGVSPSDRRPRIHLRPSDTQKARAFLAEVPASKGVKTIALQPFSTDPARNWPVAKWIELAGRLEEAGHRVLVLDSCEGRTRGFRQRRVSGRELGFVCALIAECDLLVAPDSGLGHVAAAVGTPCVGLFASQSGGVMYRHYPLHDYVEPEWDGQAHCRWPCFWERPPRCRRAAMLKEGRTCEMLSRITVERVMEAVAVRLRRGRRVPPPLPLPAMPAEARAALGPVEEIGELPVPRRDHSLDALALTRAADDLTPAAKEAFRVLRPGGVMYVRAGDDVTAKAVKEMGFRRVACASENRVAWSRA
jgi:ADP-heptose:LPS heptosyltransferase